METSTSSKTVKANTTFCLDLFKKFSDVDKTDDIFYSPFSISSALAMVMLGTGGNTTTQISEVLHFTEKQEQEMGAEQMQTQMPTQSAMQSQIRMRMQLRSQRPTRLPDYLRKCLPPQNDEDDVHASFAKLLGDLNKADAPYSLSVANRLYGEKTYQFVEYYLAGTRKYYNAELESVDFKTGAEAARININNWVEKQTQEKIKNLLAPDVVTDMTKLVLVNAIYFKGNWNKQFKEDLTVEAQFKTNKNDTKPVRMMRQKSEFPFNSIPEAKCQILEMPYKSKELSMLILLPNEIEDDTTGLEKLEMELTYEKFLEWTHPNKMRETEVDVGLPRFKMEKMYEMKDVLISMGMVDVFDVTRSNFSGMSPANDLMLSNVIHKAFVEVNEEGTEAAAATGAVVSTRSIKIPVAFMADHPFLFFIRHNPSMSILFAGRYCSPE